MTAPQSLGHSHHSGSPSSFSKRKRIAALFAAGAPVILVGRARADTYYFNRAVNNSDWNSAGDGYSSWLDATTNQPATLPTNGSNAYLLQSGTVGISNTSINFNNIYQSPGLSNAYIGSNNSINQTASASALYITNDLDCGYSGRATFTQSAGTNTFNVLTVAVDTLSSGTYTLSGGSLNLSQGAYVGSQGPGTFNQTGGVLTTDAFQVATNTYATGVYSISGTAQASIADLEIGLLGSGQFNQSGGSVSVGVFGLLIGFDNGTGVANVSGGTLSAPSQPSYIGYSGNGIVNQTGGAISATAGIYIGYASSSYSSNSTGSYTLSNSATLNLGSGASYVGYNGIGTFTQFGGTVTAGTVYLGYSSGGSGTYTMSGGTLSATNGLIYVGYGGNGTFTQTGGSVSASAIYLGYSGSSTGNYTLSNNASLNLGSGTALIGYNGTGTLTQYGGSFTAGNIYIGGANGGTGSYTILGGTLAASNVTVGYGQPSTGLFTVGGSAQVTAQSITVGDNTSGVGEYLQTGGVVNVTGGASVVGLTLGALGGAVAGATMTAGTLFLSSSAPLSVGLGTPSDRTGAEGSFNLSGGSINASAGEYIGRSYEGFGTFMQTGGSNTVSGTSALYVGFGGFANSGSYTLTGGVLSSTNAIYVGYSSMGYFTQSGGTATTGNAGVAIGDGFNEAPVYGNGVYTLSSGLLSVGGSLFVGGSTNGTFSQMGGTVTVGQSSSTNTALYIGSGTYTLRGGILTATNATYVGYQVFEGYASPAAFIQSGGTQNTSQLFVGYALPGSYSLTGGVLSVNNQILIGNGTFTLGGFGSMSAKTEIVGYTGTAHFIQTGGSNYASSALSMAYRADYAMSGGTLFAASTTIGSSGTNVTSFELSGGTFTSNAIQLNTNGIFSQTASTSVLNATTFTQSGGTVSGTLQNQGIFTYNSGIFTGQLLNQGSVVQNAAWTLGNGIYNQSTTPLNIFSYSMTLNGTGLLNDGTVILSNSLNATAEHIGYTNVGTFSQSNNGRVNSTPLLYIGSTSGASGTFTLISGILTAASTANNGQFAQSGGTATLGTVSGTGAMTLGGATEQTKVSNFQQNSIAINSGGYLAVASNTAQATNTVASLTITGSGGLDLANQYLLTTTSASTIRQYLINGANVVGTNAATWNGTGGISSVNAAASTNHLTALGYSTGTHSALGIALGLATNQTLVKYTINGDANLDGKVDISDLDIVLSNYASGKPPTWDTGDFTYAGQTDITDLNIVLSNYAKSAPNSVATPSVARSGVKAASTSSGPQTLTGTVSPAVASGAIELDVNVVTGDAVLNPNNAKVVSLQVASSSGNLIPNNWHDLSFYYGTPNWADSSFQTINLAEYDTAYTSRHNSLMLTAPVDYGDIFNTSGPHDLTFEYGIPDADGSDVDTEVGAVVYSSTPEPTTLGLMGLAMAGLMGRRRRR